MNGGLCGSRTGMGSLSGGYREGLCDWAAGHATDCCGQPRGCDQECNKSCGAFTEINKSLCTQQWMPLWQKGYMVTLFAPNVMKVMFRRERSVNNVQQKSMGHKYLLYDVMTKWSLSVDIHIFNPNFIIVTFNMLICYYCMSHYIISPHIRQDFKGLVRLNYTNSSILPGRYFWFYLCRFWNICLLYFCLNPSTVKVNGTSIVVLPAPKNQLKKSTGTFILSWLLWIIRDCPPKKNDCTC